MHIPDGYLSPDVCAATGAVAAVAVGVSIYKLRDVLADRVKQMVQQGKSLEQIKQELKMPEYADWEGKDRFPNNIEAAYRAVKG